MDEEALLALDLPSRPEAPAAARKALTSLNGALHLISSERLRDAQLLVSEIVANAVRHGSSDTDAVGIRVRATEAVMRVEVTDLGQGFDPALTPGHSLDGSGGWGLEIVAALAQRWGVEQEPATTVWFEISRHNATSRSRYSQQIRSSPARAAATVNIPVTSDVLPVGVGRDPRRSGTCCDYLVGAA